MLFTVAVFVTVAFILAMAAVLFRVYKKTHVNLFHRMRHYMDDDEIEEPVGTFTRLRDSALAALHKFAEPFRKKAWFEETDYKLRQAGIPLLGIEFIMLMFVTAVVVGLAAGLLLNNAIFGTLLFIIVSLSSGMLLTYLIHRRRRAFVNQISGCLTMVASALRAGYSFMQAMDLVSRTMTAPVSEEFTQVMQDISTGVPMEQALRNMDKRMECEDFSLVITAVLIQREVGGNLAQILDSISETINERLRMRREILTLTAQGRMSAWVLILMPFALAALVTVINENYLVPLVESQIGFMAICIAIVMEIMGYIIIQRIVNIEL